MINSVDLSNNRNKLTIKNQIVCLFWTTVGYVFARPIHRSIGCKWKIFLLRLFGAKIHSTANVYSSVRIHMPWSLEMKEFSCLTPEADCYNVAKIIIGANTIVSQKAYLCSASHDINRKDYKLLFKPIILEDQLWIGASAYVGMGVRIVSGAVVGATVSVYKDVEPWSIVGGNPAKFIKKGKINN